MQRYDAHLLDAVVGQQQPVDVPKQLHLALHNHLGQQRKDGVAAQIEFQLVHVRVFGQTVETQHIVEAVELDQVLGAFLDDLQELGARMYLAAFVVGHLEFDGNIDRFAVGHQQLEVVFEQFGEGDVAEAQEENVRDTRRLKRKSGVDSEMLVIFGIKCIYILTR